MPAVALTAVFGAMWLIAQQDVTVWAQYGALGGMVGLLMKFAKGVVDRQDRKIDELEAYIRTLHDRAETQIIPAAVKLAEVADRMMTHLERPR